MSILGGLTDTHHEVELSPSSRFVPSNWFARHMGVILLATAAVAIYVFIA